MATQRTDPAAWMVARRNHGGCYVGEVPTYVRHMKGCVGQAVGWLNGGIRQPASSRRME
jgi:hypothetical protein